MLWWITDLSTLNEKEIYFETYDAEVRKSAIIEAEDRYTLNI